VVARKEKHEIPEEELRRLYQVMTMAQLAEYYGCGESTIHARIKRYGITHDAFGEMGHKRRPREFSELHRKRMSEARKGKYGAEANGNWKGGVSQVHLRLRASKDYQDWRKKALLLRGNACQDCGKVDGAICPCCGTQVKLHVHHLFSFAKFPDKRFDPSNSEVLCPKCHYSRHKRKTG
jgi:hypothetical protein